MKQMQLERPKIFLGVNYISDLSSCTQYLPGQIIIDTLPQHDYFEILAEKYHKKFLSIELSVPHDFSSDKIADLAKEISSLIGFNEKPYMASFSVKGNSHALFFLLCEYEYYPEPVEIVAKTVHIDKDGHYCSKDTKGARKLQIKKKTNISRRNELFKGYRSGFIAQIRKLKDQIYETFLTFMCPCEYGVFTRKFRYKDLPRTYIRKAIVLNRALNTIDTHINDYLQKHSDDTYVLPQISKLLSKIASITSTGIWKYSRKIRIRVFDRQETQDSFFERCLDLLPFKIEAVYV